MQEGQAEQPPRPCGKTCSTDGEHLLHCNRGNAKHLRHNAVVNALAPALREASYQMFLEDDRVVCRVPPAQGAPASPLKARTLPVSPAQISWLLRPLA